MRQVKDFRLIRIPLGSGTAMHFMYIKEHKASIGDGVKRTMFVGNIDYCHFRSTEEIDNIMRMLFSQFGTIESISVSSDTEEETGFKRSSASRFVHVVFETRKAMTSALLASDEDYANLCEAISEKFGIAYSLRVKSSKELRLQFALPRVCNDDLEEEVNEYMRNFEESEEYERKQKEKRSREADEDGFIEVKHRHKKKRKESNKRGTGDLRSRSKKKTTELKNFYRFQMRDDKIMKIGNY